MALEPSIQNLPEAEYSMKAHACWPSVTNGPEAAEKNVLAARRPQYQLWNDRARNGPDDQRRIARSQVGNEQTRKRANTRSNHCQHEPLRQVNGEWGGATIGPGNTHPISSLAGR